MLTTDIVCLSNGLTFYLFSSILIAIKLKTISFVLNPDGQKYVSINIKIELSVLFLDSRITTACMNGSYN